MMRNHLFPSLLLVVLLLAACAPAVTATDPPAAATEPPTVVPATATAAIPETATETVVSEPTAIPVATSRGPDLYATDPSMVSLASGGLQFVEFFRFT